MQLKPPVGTFGVGPASIRTGGEPRAAINVVYAAQDVPGLPTRLTQFAPVRLTNWSTLRSVPPGMFAALKV